MLPALRDARGRPAGPIRVVAALVAFGMIGLAAPVLIALVRWAGNLVF